VKILEDKIVILSDVGPAKPEEVSFKKI